jgi:pectinesterase
VANVTVTNGGSSAVNSWSVDLGFNQSPAITNSWGANVTTSGNTVTAGNQPWNGNLSAGQSTSFGFQGTHNGNFQLPACAAN